MAIHRYGVYIIDNGAPGAPRSLGRFAKNLPAIGLELLGQHLRVRLEGSTNRLYDVRDPLHPVEVPDPLGSIKTTPDDIPAPGFSERRSRYLVDQDMLRRALLIPRELAGLGGMAPLASQNGGGLLAVGRF